MLGIAGFPSCGLLPEKAFIGKDTISGKSDRTALGESDVGVVTPGEDFLWNTSRAVEVSFRTARNCHSTVVFGFGGPIYFQYGNLEERREKREEEKKRKNLLEEERKKKKKKELARERIRTHARPAILFP